MDGRVTFWERPDVSVLSLMGFVVNLGEGHGFVEDDVGNGIFPWDLNSQGFVPLRDDLISVDSSVINGLVPDNKV